jgi:D-alanyl-D-alanine dipeptidase
MDHPALAKSRQLFLVITKDWNATTGELWRFERARPGSDWDSIGNAQVSVGRTGLAWGKGLLGKPVSVGPTKHEGDGKAPAGIFALGPAFGYANAQENGLLNYPYVQLTKDFFGVDDPKSVHYNSLVKRSEIGLPDWNSAEVMLRKDDIYQYGVVVEHNWKPGKQSEAFGSCIFMHVWSGARVPTAGCTAMSTQEMRAALKWLDASKQPRLVQLTRADYRSARKLWTLPNIEEGESRDGAEWPYLLLVGVLAVAIAAWRRLSGASQECGMGVD